MDYFYLDKLYTAYLETQNPRLDSLCQEYALAADNAEKALRSLLSPEADKAFLRYESAIVAELTRARELDYREGFRMGGGLLLELVTPPSRTECSI